MADTFGRDRDIERGLRLIPDLGEVMEEDANGETREIYEEVRTRLRVPLVNFIFRVLANYPGYLDLSWGALSPHLLTRDFERVADELRPLALVEPARNLASTWSESGELGDIRDFTDTIFYVLPKLLLAVSALDEGLGSAMSRRTEAPENSVQPGVAPGTIRLPMVSSEAASPAVNAIFDDIREKHGHPEVPSYYRGIAQRPDFLEAAWSRVAPLVNSPSYEACKCRLLEGAYQAAYELPLVGRDMVVEAGVDETRIGQLRAVLAIFRLRVIPETFIEVAAIKSLLDGPESVGFSRFSFAAG